MKCKKSIMGLAALLILVFHFYIPVGASALEMYFYRSAYIGVDLFFFVSAYSLGSKKEIKYLSFIGNRLRYIYVPFLILTVIGALYKGWQMRRVFEIISGYEFYKRGGGAFLWFVTAIMILYLVAPLLVKLKNKLGVIALPILLAGWVVLALLCQYVLEQRTLFILVNRLPIFMLGLFYDDFRGIDLKKFRLPLAVIVYFLGCVLVYKWGTMTRLNKPFYDMFYIVAIPRVAGIVMLFDELSKKIKIRNIPLSFVGKSTLELYGLQMIFGYDIEAKLYKLIPNSIGAFLVTAVILIAAAALFNAVLKLIRETLKKIRVRFKESKNNE